ncbi:hypothetical protein [Nocardioides pakistanensis]
MTAQQQKTVGIGAAIVIVALIAAYFLGISPQLETRALNQQQTDLAVHETGVLTQTLADLETKRANLGEAEREFAQIVAQFPHDYQQPDWLELVYAAAANTDVTVLSIDPGVPVDPAVADVEGGQTASPGAGDYPIAVSQVQLASQGSAEATAEFVRALENLDRPLLISDMEMSGKADNVGLLLSGKVFLTRPMERPGDALPAT